MEGCKQYTDECLEAAKGLVCVRCRFTGSAGDCEGMCVYVTVVATALRAREDKGYERGKLDGDEAACEMANSLARQHATHLKDQITPALVDSLRSVAEPKAEDS